MRGVFGAGRSSCDSTAVLCLTTATDPRWAERAVDDLPTLLADHAHCEMKAASNALSLAARLPHLPKVARPLIALAKEELDHYDGVLAELERRGMVLPPPAVDTYAAELRKVARREGKSSLEAALMDRLLVAALIEARSCERLGLVGKALAARGEPELAAFYEELFASEARHYRTFVELANVMMPDEAAVRVRLSEIAAAEGAIAARLGSSPTVHG
jgi:tRNA-(ms[2]io[6]A)-hydroxylase